MKVKIIVTSALVAIIVLIITAIISAGPIDFSAPKKDDEFKDWNRSGPFAINKFEYKIGENVFMAVNELRPTDVGNVIFVLPNATTKYISIPFDGTQKSGFNQYFKPSISKARAICSINDIIGEWIIVFQGTEYQPLRFRILNDTIPTEVGNFERVC